MRLEARNISRRDVFKIASGGTAGFAASQLIGMCGGDTPQPQVSPEVTTTPTSTPRPIEVQPAIAPQPDLLQMSTADRRHFTETFVLAHSFMKLSVPKKGETNERSQLEEQLFGYLENKKASAGDVLTALQVAGTTEARGWGMELIWRKRQAGELSKHGIHPLDKDRIDWALKHQVDPRMLAICREAIYPAYEMLKAAPELFFEAVPQDERDHMKIEDTLPNPGVVAKLNMTETGSINEKSPEDVNKYWGFVFIGGTSAWTELNLSSDWFPKGHEHLEIISDRLQKQTGLPYNDYVETLPGSERGDPVLNGSGGAIGPQFMPINALLFMDWYSEANKRLGNKYPEPNPFDPYTGTIMSYLYLASEFYGRHGDVTDVLTITRPGYNAQNTDEKKIDSLRKWNPTEQARIALDAGYDYYNTIGRV